MLALRGRTFCEERKTRRLFSRTACPAGGCISCPLVWQPDRASEEEDENMEEEEDDEQTDVFEDSSPKLYWESEEEDGEYGG